jgi:hypothetical protein
MEDQEYIFSASEIDSFVKIRQDYLDGKSRTHNWDEVKEMLNDKYGDSEEKETDL